MSGSKLKRVEFVIIFVAIPLFIFLNSLDREYIFAILFGVTTYALIRVKRIDPEFQFGSLWHPPKWKQEKAVLQKMITRFVVVALVMTSLTGILFPDDFFGMVRNDPSAWLIAAVLYPLLSVYPQEIIYRLYLFRCFRDAFSSANNLMIASAVSFGFMHIIFGNAVAPILAFVGGWFFANTYHDSRSLRLAVIEHTLYGEVILLCGLGSWFMHGELTLAVSR